jgi:hypothetical protein
MPDPDFKSRLNYFHAFSRSGKAVHLLYICGMRSGLRTLDNNGDIVPAARRTVFQSVTRGEQESARLPVRARGVCVLSGCFKSPACEGECASAGERHLV